MSRPSLAWIFAVTFLTGLAAHGSAWAQPPAKQLGKVHFATTCTPAAPGHSRPRTTKVSEPARGVAAPK